LAVSRRSSRGRILLVLLAISGALLPARIASGQEPDQHERWADATWVDDLNFLAANALLGGIAGGVGRILRHGSFTEGFARGALGGGVAYVGKRIAVARFDGAGFVGLEISAVGGSITRNAALGVALLDTLVLPVGPFWAFVPPHTLGASRVRLDLYNAWWLVYGITEDRLKLDWPRTLSAGAPVFRAAEGLLDGGDPVDGEAVGGIIVLSPSAGRYVNDVFAHERVHLLQRDFFETAAGLAVEDWVGAKLGAARLPFFEWVMPGLGYLLVRYPLHGPWGTSRSVLEVEAYFLEAR
jgi:hypothetical protein